MLPRLLFLLFSLLPAIVGLYLHPSLEPGNLPNFSDCFLSLWSDLPIWVKELPHIPILVISMGLIWCASLFIRYKKDKAKAPMMFTLVQDTIIAVALSGFLAWALPTLVQPLLTNFQTPFGQQGWTLLAGLAILILVYYLSYALFQQNNRYGWTRFWKVILVFAYVLSFIFLTYASPSSHLFFVLSYLLIETYVICLRTFHTSSEMPNHDDIPDAFGRQAVVEDCIERLKLSNQLNEPCNIALTGKWGSGKTFTMREVFQRLKNGRPEDKATNQPAEEPTPVLYINPWHLHSITDIQNAIIEGIYHTIRPRSCFSFPPLFKLLRHLTQMAGEPHLSHCYDALTELIKTPGSPDTTTAQLSLNAAIRQPIVIFLDDLERVQPEVLKQIFPLLDSLSPITKIHFFVSINEETLHSFKEEKALRDLYGYFNKVFHAFIPLPLIIKDFYMAFVESYISSKLASKSNTSKQYTQSVPSQLSNESKKQQEIISAVFKTSSEHGKHALVYYPPTPRILIHSLDSMLALTQGPLKKLLSSQKDRHTCWKLLRLHHFFFCMKEESPALYLSVQRANPWNYARVLWDIVKENSEPHLEKNSGNQSLRNPILRSDAKDYSLLNYINYHLIARDNNAPILKDWESTDLNTVLNGELYFESIPTSEELISAFQPGSNGRGVIFTGKTDIEKRHKFRYFWRELTKEACGLSSRLSDIMPSQCTEILKQNADQIPQYEEAIFPILYEIAPSFYLYDGLTSREDQSKILIDNLSVNASLRILAIRVNTNRGNDLTQSFFGQLLIDRVKRYFSNEFGQLKDFLPIHQIETLVEEMGRVDAPFAEKLVFPEAISLKSNAAKIMALKMACIITEYIGPTYVLAKKNLLPALLNAIQHTSFKLQGKKPYISKEYIEGFHSDQMFFSHTTPQLHDVHVNMLLQKIDEILDQ